MFSRGSEVDSETKQLGASKGLGATIRTDISDDEGSDEEDNQAQDSRAHATAHTADKPATSAAANKALSAKAVPAPEISVGSIHLMQGEHQGKALAAPAAAARKTDLASKSLSLKPVLAPVPVNAAARCLPALRPPPPAQRKQGNCRVSEEAPGLPSVLCLVPRV